MSHPDKKLSWLLGILLLLRFSLVFEFLFKRYFLFDLWIVTIGIYLLTYLTLRHIWNRRVEFHIQMPSLSQILIWGVGLGFVLLAIDVYTVSVAHGTHLQMPKRFFILIFTSRAITQFLVAATIEEPMFRGILWGYLKNLGRPDWLIFIIQAVLFFLAHSYYAQPAKFVYWFNTITMALFFGFAAWKTRSIIPSMVLHAIGNCASLFFDH